ncbi:hypothetical protein [Streptomyces sp. CBG9]|uniref:hypothetical protein n=1 Tax=Streptomyces sp. CBG9 TaxID=2762622 RepID=UPI001645DDDB|nr:hypothetical protein [Streptomyces sp. CBG9]
MPRIVYLDQNHWITLAQARRAPEKIPNEEEREAADQLWELATTGLVRLPLSFAHLGETAHAGNGQRRRDLAETMLEAYDGWHMMHPLAITRHEFQAAFGGPALTSEDVFTTAADSPFSTYTPDPRKRASDSARRSLAELTWRAAWSCALLEDTLSEEEAEAEARAVDRWMGALTNLAQLSVDSPIGEDRGRAALQLVAGFQKEIALAAMRAGLSAAEMHDQLIEDPTALIARMPSCGRSLEIVHARLRNATDKWRRSDMNDLYFLAPAAAYAHYVAAEKKTGNYLMSSTGRTTPGASVHLNLRSLLKQLRQDMQVGVESAQSM